MSVLRRIKLADERSALRVTVIALVSSVATLPFTLFADDVISRCCCQVGMLTGVGAAVTAVLARLDAYFAAGGFAAFLLSGILAH